MAKSSRWSQWVIAESAKPRVPLAWTLVARNRRMTPVASALV